MPFVIDPGLDGRVAMITGANHGIGAATACALAAQGAKVFVTYLRLDPAAHPKGFLPEYGRMRAHPGEIVMRRIRAAGGVAAEMEADLADPAAAGLLFDAARAVIGPVEILVNNASGWLADTFLPAARDRFGRTLRAVDADSYHQQFVVDARAAALLIAEFARRHIARGARWGRIIGLTSGGPDGFPEEVSYGAAKAAQVSYTMSAARELARHGVTANVVYPPITDTGWITQAVREAAANASPHGRVADPADVADVIVYLASDQARHVTGQIIRMS